MSDRDERRRARIEAERARRRRARRQKRAKRPLVVAIATSVVVVGGATAVLVATSGDDGAGDDGTQELASIGRRGSTVVDGADAVDIVRTPASARIVYRVETAGREISVLTDVVSSKRPFDSRLDTKEGAPPGGETFSSRIGTYLLTSTESSGAPSVLQVAPALPPTDLRLEVALPEAVERGLVERREVRRVADRLCQIYRSRQTLAAVVEPPTDTDHADTCVDEAGLVLEEVVTADGQVLTRRVAVEVDEDPTLADDLFAVDGDPVPAASGGGFVRRVKAGSTPPGEFLVLDEAPEGFEYLGRFSVVPPQPENFGDDPLRESFRRAGVVDAWRRGVDIVAIDQGGTLRGGEAFQPTAGAPKIEVAPFGEAELLLSGAGVELRAPRDGGRYVRIYGTIPIEELRAIAGRLRAVDGGDKLELEDE
ncbi:MAG TPA: hypothetical protein VM345_20090 [Acidimicrobiales bacterium]|nr:hypothetical protein [Acidimicrobiales bacterium]